VSPSLLAGGVIGVGIFNIDDQLVVDKSG